MDLKNFSLLSPTLQILSKNNDLQLDGDMLITETQTYAFLADCNNERYGYVAFDKVDEITEVTVKD